MVFYVFDLMHLDGERSAGRCRLHARKEALAQLLAKRAKRGPLRFSESIDRARTGACSSTPARWAWKASSPSAPTRPTVPAAATTGSRPNARTGRNSWSPALCRRPPMRMPSARWCSAITSTASCTTPGAPAPASRHADGARLYRKLKALERAGSPFDTVPTEERGARRPIWVEPKLVAEVDFHGWTHGDRVRQASFQGLREDKPAKEVVREVKAGGGGRQDGGRSAARRQNAVAKANGTASAASALSHPDRVYWEDAGVTKRDLAEYYSASLEMDARRTSSAGRFRCCAVRTARPANASSRSTPPPASPPSICISSPRRATRSFRSTISTD